MRNKLKTTKIKSVFDACFPYIKCFIIAILTAWIVVTFIGQRTVVDGHSMENTLFHQDNLIVDKISYRFKNPERFDIIVFPHMLNGQEKYYIKRIIGLPGEKVYIDDQGTIYINDKLLNENFGKEPIEVAGIASSPIILKNDEYFVLGDNRNHSSDSRDISVGLIDSEEIIGKAFFRMYPFSRAEFLE